MSKNEGRNIAHPRGHLSERILTRPIDNQLLWRAVGLALVLCANLLWLFAIFDNLQLISGDHILGNPDFYALPAWMLAFFAADSDNAPLWAVINFLLLTANYVLLEKILGRYLDAAWSVSIAMLSIWTVWDAPFRDFLVTLLTTWSIDETTLPSAQPEMLKVLSPNLTNLAFMALFLASIQLARGSARRTTVLTAAWALSAYLHVSNAIFGCLFWLTFLCAHRILGQKEFFNDLIVQLLVTASIISPVIASQGGALRPDTAIAADLTYLVIYFLLPALALLGAYFANPFDKRDLIYKFSHIGIFVAFEGLLLATTHAQAAEFAFLGLQRDSVITSLIHFYYYVPAIYFITRPHYISHKNDGRAAQLIKYLSVEFFNRHAKYILAILSLFVTFFSAISAFSLLTF